MSVAFKCSFKRIVGMERGRLGGHIVGVCTFHSYECIVSVYGLEHSIVVGCMNVCTWVRGTYVC